MLTQALLKELFRYDPVSGKLFYRYRKRVHFKTDRAWTIWNSRFWGKEAGSIRKNRGAKTSYRTVGLFYGEYRVHRLIWCMVTGKFPENEVDHEDHNGLNNRFENLKEATYKSNALNMPQRCDNATGVTGVSFHRGRYTARIQRDGKSHYLGSSTSLEVVSKLRKKAEQELEFHMNHGKKHDVDI